jgi:hypothetical protein
LERARKIGIETGIHSLSEILEQLLGKAEQVEKLGQQFQILQGKMDALEMKLSDVAQKDPKFSSLISEKDLL